MKAFLLAAGYGTRLRPITDNMPKCLVPIQHQPLLYWWLKLLQKYRVSEVLINTHYRSEQVEHYVEGLQQSDLKIKLVFEQELLGSGGTVKKNADFVSNEKDFLICYADNLTCLNISKLLSFHASHPDVLTMGLFLAGNPGQCGIAVMNPDNVITKFSEKPVNPKSNLANAGIYAADQRLFDYFPAEKPVFDFGYDILPLLIGKMRGYRIREYLLDIGTWENYKKANEDWKNDYI
ncbi:MAG: nucleotidyltransferase family protein [Veillonellales bacterium]